MRKRIRDKEREIRMGKETERETERWRRGAEIKIAERREIRQRLFPQDVVTTTTKRQRGQHHSLVPSDTCKSLYECESVCVCVCVCFREQLNE